MKFESQEEELAYNNLCSLYVFDKTNIFEYLQAQLTYLVFNLASNEHTKKVKIDKKGYTISEIVLPFFGKFICKYKSIDTDDGKDIDLKITLKASNKVKNDLNHMVHGKVPPTSSRHMQRISKKVKDILGINK
jgi:hypothetical protein